MRLSKSEVRSQIGEPSVGRRTELIRVFLLTRHTTISRLNAQQLNYPLIIFYKFGLNDTNLKIIQV